MSTPCTTRHVHCSRGGQGGGVAAGTEAASGWATKRTRRWRSWGSWEGTGKDMVEKKTTTIAGP